MCYVWCVRFTIINYKSKTETKKKIISLRLIDWIRSLLWNEWGILRILLLKAIEVSRVYLDEWRESSSLARISEKEFYHVTIFPRYSSFPFVVIFIFLVKKKHTAHQQTTSASFTCVEIPNNLSENISLTSIDV